MHKAIVIRPEFAPGRRIIAVSDIHGNLNFFQGLMKKIALSPSDILVLVGDLFEKGPDSLGLLRYIMELERTHTVYPLCGNLDGLVFRFLEDDALDEKLFPSYLHDHPESLLRQLAREGGFEQLEDLAKLRADLHRAYPEVWTWLCKMPTILETEHLVFVHGGVPSLDHMEELDRWGCMKNDNFVNQGHTFPKWVIVGHWPVTLYNERIPSAAPLLLPEQKIASIDGGCVLKADGQLNALILPTEASEDFTWEAYDGLPTMVALDSQEPSANSVNIRWGRSYVDILEPGEELTLCRHRETGRELYILNSYLRQGPLTTYRPSPNKGPWCEDSTDYLLPVSPGDRLKVVAATKQGTLCKKKGVTGWYRGRLTPPL